MWSQATTRRRTIGQDKDRDSQASFSATCDMELFGDLCSCGGDHGGRYGGDECEARDDEGSSPFLLLCPTVSVQFSFLYIIVRPEH